MGGVGHKHAIAACEREIGGESRTLIAALFLDDLHEQDLTPVDDVLDLVAAAQGHTAAAQIFGCMVIMAIATC